MPRSAWPPPWWPSATASGPVAEHDPRSDPVDLLFGLGICCLAAASIPWVVVWLALKPYRPPRQQPADTGADGHGTTGARGPGDGLSGAALDSPQDATPVRLS